MSAPAGDPVRTFLAAYAAAAAAGDADALVALYADDVRVFDMWGRWSLHGLPAWRAVVQAWLGGLGGESVRVGFDEVEATVVDGLAIGAAIATYTALSADGTPLRSLDNRFTVALRRVGGAWKVFHEHTPAPIAHDTLTASLRRH